MGIKKPMNDKQSFKISLDSKQPQNVLKAKRENIRIDKLNRRITIVAFFLIVVIAAVAVALYLNMMKKFETINVAGAREIEEVAAKLDTRFSTLSEKLNTIQKSSGKLETTLTNLEKSYDNKIVPMDEFYMVFEQTNKKIKERLSSLEKDVKQINQTKPDKNTLTESLDNINESLSQLRTDMKQFQTQMDVMKENYNAELSNMGESLKSLKVSVFRMENNVKEAVDIAGAGIDPEALNKALEQQKNEYLEKIDDIFKNLQNKQNRLELMEKRIRNLQNEQKQMRQELEKKISMSNTKQNTAGKSPPGSSGSRTITVKPPPGKIIEQELE